MPKKTINYLESAKAIISNVQNMAGGNLSQNNIIIALIFLICVYIFTKSPMHLTGFLAHPFSLTALVVASAYYFKENNIPMAGIIALLVVVTVVTKKESDIQNIMPIINREHFSDGKDEDDNQESEEDEEESDEEGYEDEEDSEDEEDDEDKEAFVGGKYSSKNLNDTFKNLHDAIHQLENFISTSEA